VGVFVLQSIVEWHALVILDNLHALNHPSLAKQAQVTDGLQRNLTSQLLQPVIVVTSAQLR
jgi:hypothetical protein